MTPSEALYIGIDVSKTRLDMGAYPGTHPASFSNDDTGRAQLIEALKGLHPKLIVIEAALAHKDSNAIRAVYNRATYIKERQQLAQWWADELEVMRDGGKVLNFNKTGV